MRVTPDASDARQVSRRRGPGRAGEARDRPRWPTRRDRGHPTDRTKGRAMPAPRTTRRFFLTATGGAALGAGEWAGLLPLSPAGADEATVTPDLVRFGPELEPVVRLIEETPRAGCPAMMIGQLRKGLPYRNFLAALFLANLRT